MHLRLYHRERISDLHGKQHWKENSSMISIFKRTRIRSDNSAIHQSFSSCLCCEDTELIRLWYTAWWFVTILREGKYCQIQRQKLIQLIVSSKGVQARDWSCLRRSRSYRHWLDLDREDRPRRRWCTSLKIMFIINDKNVSYHEM